MIFESTQSRPSQMRQKFHRLLASILEINNQPLVYFSNAVTSVERQQWFLPLDNTS